MNDPFPPVRFQGFNGRSWTFLTPKSRTIGISCSLMKTSYGFGGRLKVPDPAFLALSSGSCQCPAVMSCIVETGPSINRLAYARVRIVRQTKVGQCWGNVSHRDERARCSFAGM